MAVNPEKLMAEHAGGQHYSSNEVIAWFNNLHGEDSRGIGFWPAEVMTPDGVLRGFGYGEDTQDAIK